MKPILLLLLGSSGTGKSALASAIKRGERCLVDLPLPERIWSGTVVNASNSKCVYNIACTNRENKPVLPIVKEGIGNADCMIMDPWNAQNAIVEQCGDEFDIINVYTVAPIWLAKQRLCMRYTICDQVEKYRQVDAKWCSAQNTLTFYENGAADIYADTRDWPIREIGKDDIASIINDAEPGTPTLDVQRQYQQSLHINGVWCGRRDSRQPWEANRLDTMLPADMTNMTLLDIGASDGGFCYEALNRGAFYATALESREDRVEFMRHVRDTCQLAMGVAHLNIVADTIPAIQVWETPRRYDVGLLLNVLHHMGTEEVAVSVFGKVLDVCEHLVVEGPFCESGIEKGHGPSPNALCISDQWVAGVANLYGHKVTEILPSKMQPPYRKVWKMSRASA